MFETWNLTPPYDNRNRYDIMLWAFWDLGMPLGWLSVSVITSLASTSLHMRKFPASLRIHAFLIDTNVMEHVIQVS
jgi:hypothetical protein